MDHIVGRTSELASLTMLLDAIPAGGGAVVLRGEAGIGKSTLLEAVAGLAISRGMDLLRVAGLQSETHVPFAGIHQLLRPLLDRVEPEAIAARSSLLAAAGATDEAPTHPLRLGQQLLAMIARAATDGPLVLLVEDAQWLDRPSWDLLAFLGRRLSADPVALVAAMRDSEETNGRLLGAGLPELGIKPLSTDASASLLDRQAPHLAPALRERILIEAEGNPLGLVELPRAASRSGESALLPAWLPLSTRLEQTFSTLVAELPQPTRTVLTVAAVNDGNNLREALDAGSTMLGRALDLTDVQAAVAARLVEVDDTYGVRFRHPLIRSAVHQMTTVAERQRAHAALAQLFADQPDRSVWHRAAAAVGTDDALAADLAEAAARAHRRGALSVSVLAYERAADLTAGHAERMRRLFLAADVATEIGDHPTVVRLMQLIDDSELDAADRAWVAWFRETLIERGWSGATKMGRFVDIAERLHAAGDDDRALESLKLISIRGYWSNPDDDVRALIVEAAERLSVDPLEPRLIAVLGLTAPIERGAVVIERVRKLTHSPDIEPEHVNLLGLVAGAVGALDISKHFHAEAITGMRAQGRLGPLAQALVGYAWTVAYRCETRRVQVAATEAAALATETGQPLWAVTADLAGAHAATMRGETEGVAEVLDRSEAFLMMIGAHPMSAMVRMVRGIGALADGRHADAYDELNRIFDPSDLSYHRYLQFFALGHLAEAAVHGGRHDELREHLGALEPLAEQSGSPVLQAGLAYCRAVLATDSAADAAYRDALGADLSALPFEQARLSLAYGEWLRRHRRAAEARPFLRAACATFDGLGTRSWADRARRELRASGETVRPREDATDRLTPQELQIAQLAADGLKNRAIAERLYVSPRTVSTHLSRVYAKVGVTSRGELAKAMSSAVP